MSIALPEFELERYLPFRFTVLAGRLSGELAKQYKVKYGITMPGMARSFERWIHR